MAYASRVLSDTETRYFQIEKFTLGVTYGLERFHDFVYGRKVLVETDHKPLIAIAKKSVGDMPPRLQRFFLRLMKYDFQLKFIPGKDLVIPDALSRAFSKSKKKEQSEYDVEGHAVGVEDSMVSPKTREQLMAETGSDETHAQVINSLKHPRPIQGLFRAIEGKLTSRWNSFQGRESCHSSQHEKNNSLKNSRWTSRR